MLDSSDNSACFWFQKSEFYRQCNYGLHVIVRICFRKQHKLAGCCKGAVGEGRAICFLEGGRKHNLRKGNLISRSVEFHTVFLRETQLLSTKMFIKFTSCHAYIRTYPKRTCVLDIFVYPQTHWHCYCCNDPFLITY